MFPPKINLGTCPLCKGNGFRKDSDFTKLECICEETGNNYFIPSIFNSFFNNDTNLILLDYKDRWLYNILEEYLKIENEIDCPDGIRHRIYINNKNRLEPFYTYNNYDLKNHYRLIPVENPLFPFERK